MGCRAVDTPHRSKKLGHWEGKAMGFLEKRKVEGLTSELKRLVPELDRAAEALGNPNLLPLHPEDKAWERYIGTPAIYFVQFYDELAYQWRRLDAILFWEEATWGTPERLSAVADARRALERHEPLRARFGRKIE
jgi:hypothetical protein